MSWSWRYHLTAALGTAAFLAAGAAAALEPPALEELETLLRDLGFDPGEVDGVVDEDTVAAIRRYQEFALLPGDPEPSEKLLNELRGVTAAFAALNAGKEKPPATAPAPEVPDLGAGAPRNGGAQNLPTPVAEKVIVPPPPPPPKLKPLEAARTEASGAATEEQEQLAELPPEEIRQATPPQESLAPEAALAAPAAEAPAAEAAAEEALDPAAALAARVEAELAPYRADLAAGRVTPQALAQRFNDFGRQALQASQYDEAILKFSVAIHLFPEFAGAYSNRGTAYQRREQPELAAKDFESAGRLGFGGVRLKNQKMPMN
ncbi:peptidoglycan-binding protein [Pelagibius sp. CAU 1746]|uniref:peptidoglycan-binding protein n=1 Tax=Pelagibius sp. CAU 1746 TaxID=3140370 RepID=UPI00325A7D7B